MYSQNAVYLSASVLLWKCCSSKGKVAAEEQSTVDPVSSYKIGVDKCITEILRRNEGATKHDSWDSD
jgi:hypothetical protein